jgi:hypothetical protein
MGSPPSGAWVVFVFRLGFARAHPRLITDARSRGLGEVGDYLRRVRCAHPRLATDACSAGSNAVGGNLDVVGFARAHSRLHRVAPFGGLVGFCLPPRVRSRSLEAIFGCLLRRLIHGNGVGHGGWKVVPHIRKPKMDDAVVGHLSLSCRGAGVCLLRQQQEWSLGGGVPPDLILETVVRAENLCGQ